MDNKNYFESTCTYSLHRAEYFFALIVTAYFILANWQAINWWHFIILFSYIDLIGYIPGSIAYRLSDDKKIGKIFYVLYNCMHSLITAGVVAGLWCLFIGLEWALLALSIHLFGDRAIFGNFLKPFSVSFEPIAHPAYKRFMKEIE